jgi:hypothetical protein
VCNHLAERIKITSFSLSQMMASMMAAVTIVSDTCYTGPGPPQPWNFSCSEGANSLQISAAVDETTDKVSIELYQADDVSQRPNIHYTMATKIGRISGFVPGLDVNTQYKAALRAHRKGCAEDGGNGTWSNLTWHESLCRTAINGTAGPRARTAINGTAGPNLGPATHWLEVFRVAEAGRTLPDFLDNHDSGDMGGDGAIISAMGDYFQSFPITRYCVEVLNTTVANTTTTTSRGAPVPSPYSDYRSSNPPWLLESIGAWGILPYGENTQGAEYNSWCELAPDRYAGHLSRANILAAGCDTNHTSPTFMVCRCSEASSAASRMFTGMMPINLPILSGLPSQPGVYPRPGTHVGQWYFHPAHGRCSTGKRVGEGGCTWQQSPLSHSIYFDTLNSLGWNSTPYNTTAPDAYQPVPQTRANLEIFRKAWRGRGLAPCGGNGQ